MASSASALGQASVLFGFGSVLTSLSSLPYLLKIEGNQPGQSKSAPLDQKQHSGRGCECYLCNRFSRILSATGSY